MATASTFRQEAARRFPYSAKRKSIIGDGPFGLVLKCTRPWSVILLQTRQMRDEAARTWEQQHRYKPCCGEHEKIDLNAPAAAPVPVVGYTPIADRFPDDKD